jgi:cell wall-associated NlpC family hydrolase
MGALTLDLTPHASAAHWSAGLVGAPWRQGAEGPDAFDCWGLVLWVQRRHFGREMPRLAVNVRTVPREQWGALRALVQRSEWRRSERRHEGDLLLVENADGPHIGIVLASGREGPRLLHACGGVDVQGRPFGDVRVDPIATLALQGFIRPEGWAAA